MIRPASVLDTKELVPMLERYVQETFSSDWGGTESMLRAALASGLVRILISARDDVLVGFAALVDDYDLHHCVRGLRVVDLYVVRAQRGRCIGATLLAHVAHHALSGDFAYIRGEAVPSPAARRLFERFALQFGDSYNLSGQALRELADLRDLKPRELARRMLNRDTNRDP
jgi:GNAT superfamily N-acetyltransferase